MGMILTTLRAAVLHSLHRPSEAPSRFWRAGVSIVGFFRTREVSPYAERRLISGCLPCPIFDPKWRACGNGKERLANGDFVGCLCAMDFKVKIPGATCWLHDQGVTDEGWPKET